MASTFVCKACGLGKERNYRLGVKEQEYCNDRKCRRAYRREYQKRRIRDEPEYGQKQKACKARSRKLSGAKYQRGYRENNPDYTKEKLRTANAAQRETPLQGHLGGRDRPDPRSGDCKDELVYFNKT